jgi:hypothetical protein
VTVNITGITVAAGTSCADAKGYITANAAARVSNRRMFVYSLNAIGRTRPPGRNKNSFSDASRQRPVSFFSKI